VRRDPERAESVPVPTFPASRATRRILVPALALAGVLTVAPIAGAATRTQTPIPPTTAPAPTATTAPAPAAAPTPPPTPGGSVSWRPEGRTAAGRPLVYRGNANGVELAWIDPQLTRLVFAPGTRDPGGPWSWGGQIPGAVRPLLVAAFNGGFQMQDIPGGFYHEGRTVKSLVPGQGSLVIYNDGRATVGEWGRDVSLTPDVVSVRQNLGLLVDNGAPVPSAANPGAWGLSVAGIATARSAIGVDANGGIIVGMARVVPQGLAQAMIAAGAVRAMQMDINPDWVTFGFFGTNPDGSVTGGRVMGTGGPSNLYLTPYTRDFFAVLLEPHVVAGGSRVLGTPPVGAAAKVKVRK
jgi:hypothetical protein